MKTTKLIRRIIFYLSTLKTLNPLGCPHPSEGLGEAAPTQILPPFFSLPNRISRMSSGFSSLAITRSISRAPYSRVKPFSKRYSRASLLSVSSTLRTVSLSCSRRSFLSGMSEAMWRSMSLNHSLTGRHMSVETNISL